MSAEQLCLQAAQVVPSRILKQPPAPHAPRIVVRPEPRLPRHPLPQPLQSRAITIEESESKTDQFRLLTTQTDKTRKSQDSMLIDGPFAPPSRGELYRRVPQSKEMTYKYEATFYNVLFLLVKNGWLIPHEKDTINSWRLCLR